MDQQLAGAAPDLLGEQDSAAFHAHWQALLERFQRRFWWLDPARIEDALADALLHRLMQNNGKVQQGQKEGENPSDCWLYDEVRHLLSNGLRSEQRRRHREQEYARQRTICFFEGYFVQNGLSAEHLGLEDHSDEQWEWLLSECDAWEQQFVALRRQGVKDLTVYVEVLGIVAGSLEERRRALARTWNRLRMKWRRRREKQCKC